MGKTAQIGPIVLTEQQLDEYLENNQRYIVTRHKVYEIRLANYKPEFLPFYGAKVYESTKNIIQKIEFEAHTADEVNKLIGFELFTH